MNYERTDDLDFGIGDTTLDPRVTAGKGPTHKPGGHQVAVTFTTDTAVLELPNGCTVISVERHGVSFWAHTGRIDVELVNGSSASFFIKALSGETGQVMVQSEYESMSSIYALTPDFAPKPIAVSRAKRRFLASRSLPYQRRRMSLARGSCPELGEGVLVAYCYLPWPHPLESLFCPCPETRMTNTRYCSGEPWRLCRILISSCASFAR